MNDKGVSIQKTRRGLGFLKRSRRRRNLSSPRLRKKQKSKVFRKLKVEA